MQVAVDLASLSVTQENVRHDMIRSTLQWDSSEVIENLYSLNSSIAGEG